MLCLRVIAEANIRQLSSNCFKALKYIARIEGQNHGINKQSYTNLPMKKKLFLNVWLVKASKKGFLHSCLGYETSGKPDNSILVVQSFVMLFDHIDHIKLNLQNNRTHKMKTCSQILYPHRGLGQLLCPILADTNSIFILTVSWTAE